MTRRKAQVAPAAADAVAADWQQTFDAIPDGITILDPDGTIVRCNRAFARMMGLPPEQITGRICAQVVHGSASFANNCPLVRARASRHREQFEFERDGRRYQASVDPILDEHGAMARAVHVVVDITDRVRMETRSQVATAALRESEDRYRDLVENNRDMICTHDLAGNLLSVNEAAARSLGYSRDELQTKNLREFLAPEARKLFAAYLSRLRRRGHARGRMHVLTVKGKTRCWEYDNTVRTAGVSDPIVRGIAHDITEREQAEKTLRETSVRLAEMMNSFNSLVYVADMETYELLFMNEYGRKIWGDIQGKICWQTLQENQAGPCAFCTNSRLRNADGSSAGVYVWEFQNTKNGHWYDCRDQAIRWDDQRLVRMEIATDITARKLTEQALAESEAKFREMSAQFHALLDAIPDSLALLSPDLRVLWANRGAAAGLNKEPSELIGAACYSLWHGRTASCDACPVLRSFGTGEPAMDVVTSPDGKIRELRTVPIKEEGRVVNVIEVVRDISEHRQIEAQLRQIQKMESVGTLAGGIAHDFNNILGAVIGYGQVALMTMAQDDPQRPNIDHMLEAASRAARLTKDLLLFSRKQLSNKKPVDLVKITRKVLKLLTRVIGEDVECRTSLPDAPITVLAEEHQIEQVLMNLATNARDEMPKGGVFSVTVEQAVMKEEFSAAHGFGSPGTYALITVSDTGSGMDQATQQRIFEPFFTTKATGKGTGLGLSVVYGIIKHHSGYIGVESEPGIGTTFRIYLPIVTTSVQEEQPPSEQGHASGGTETILLAEDDKALLTLMTQILTKSGYTVIAASDGEDAVRKFGKHPDEIHLLLFDLVMPKMDGKEACDAIRKTRPGLKAIFVSGYAPEVVQQKLSLEPGVTVLSKPVQPGDLLRKVREVLDRKD